MNVPLPAGKANSRLLADSKRLFRPTEAGKESNPALSVVEGKSRLEQPKPGKYRALSNIIRVKEARIASTGKEPGRS